MQSRLKSWKEGEERKELLRHAEQAEETAYRLGKDAELERLRVVADETKKWEECEARWVERISELESVTRSLASGGPTTVTFRRGEETSSVAAMDREATKSISSPRYVTVTSKGHGYRCSPEKRVAFDDSRTDKSLSEHVGEGVDDRPVVTDQTSLVAITTTAGNGSAPCTWAFLKCS